MNFRTSVRMVFLGILGASFLLAGCNNLNTTGDTTAPSVLSTSPANASIDVALNSNITVNFSENMKPETITSANLILATGDSVIPAAVTYAGSVASLNPTVDLAYNTLYVVTVTNSVKDLAGNSPLSNTVWSFTTLAQTDTLAPTVSVYFPADTEVSVPINSSLTATFNEAMDSATIVSNNFTLKKGVNSIPGTVSYSGLIATFNPTADLEYETLYTVKITTSVKDVAGNSLAANLDWSFTTGTAPDVTAPVVNSTVPTNSAVNVALNATISGTFSESLSSPTVVSSNFIVTDGTTAVAGTIVYSGTTATFTPTNGLLSNTTYTATLTTGIKDLSDNSLAVNKVWTFSTGAALDLTPPTVSVTVPSANAVEISVNTPISAQFSETMDSGTIISNNFTVMEGLNTVSGVVTYDGVNKKAVFTPSVNLVNNKEYRVTVTTGVKDLSGNSIGAALVWTFTTVTTGLGSAGNFVILAKTGISTVPNSVITGDIGVSPAAESFMTGFSQTQATGYSTSTQVDGKMMAADMTDPTPSTMTTATADVAIAYTDAAGRVTPDFTDLHTGILGGQTLIPGLYKYNTSVTIPTDVTLNGGSSDVWIFQISGDITLSGGMKIILSGGALAKNIFWQLTGAASLQAASIFEGIILSETSITLGTGAVLNGRALAKTLVALDQATVTQPAP